MDSEGEDTLDEVSILLSGGGLLALEVDSGPAVAEQIEQHLFGAFMLPQSTGGAVSVSMADKSSCPAAFNQKKFIV